MITRVRKPSPSSRPLKPNSNTDNVSYRKPVVVRSADGTPVGTIKEGTRTTVDYDVPVQTRELTWWDQASLVGEGIVNQATDYQGIVNPSYGNRSILNKAIDRTIQGDFAGAGEIISQNPARFAGNVIFEAGTAIIPVGAVAKGVATGTRVARSGIQGAKYGVENSSKIRIAKSVARQIKRDPKMLVPKKSVDYFTGERLPGTRGYFEKLSFVTGLARLDESEIPRTVRKTRKLIDSMTPPSATNTNAVRITSLSDNIASNPFIQSDKIKPRSRINYIPNPLNAYQKADVTYKSSTGNFKKASVKRPKPNTGRV